MSGIEPLFPLLAFCLLNYTALLSAFAGFC